MVKIRRALRSTTGRLAETYLLIIMLMSLGFSIVFFNASSHQLGRQVPPNALFRTTQNGQDNDRSGTPPPQVNAFFTQRITEGRHDLLIRLIELNVIALVVGSVVSYYLARRTLAPIEAAMVAQSQFVSDASHELRTPLTALQLTNEVALRNKKLSHSEALDIISYNVAEAEKLKSLSDSLLGFLKNEQSTVEFESVQLTEVIAAAVDHVEKAASQKQVEIIIDVTPQTIRGEYQSLVRLVVILLDNAVKYSAPKTTVEIKTELQAKHIQLEIVDHGPGIDPKDLPHIFERFYRVDRSRSSQHTEGFGLGLAIAKSIAARHHTHIVASSKVGIGTSFSIRLLIA